MGSALATHQPSAQRGMGRAQHVLLRTLAYARPTQGVKPGRACTWYGARARSSRVSHGPPNPIKRVGRIKRARPSQARAKPEPSQGWHDVRGATLTPIPHRCQQRPRRTRAPTPCTERGRVYVCVVSRSIKQGIKIAPGRSRRACVLGVLGQLGPQLLQGRANGSDPRDEAHDHVKTWSRCGAPATGGASVHARLLLRPSTCGGGACRSGRLRARLPRSLVRTAPAPCLGLSAGPIALPATARPIVVPELCSRCQRMPQVAQSRRRQALTSGGSCTASPQITQSCMHPDPPSRVVQRPVSDRDERSTSVHGPVARGKPA